INSKSNKQSITTQGHSSTPPIVMAIQSPPRHCSWGQWSVVPHQISRRDARARRQKARSTIQEARLRTSHLALMVFFAAVCLEARSQQTQLTNLGFLICSLSEVAENQEETVAGPLRQTRDMLCAFKPGDGGPEETYTGTFQSVGRDQRGSVD